MKDGLLDLEDRLMVLSDAYEALYLLACYGSDVGADRVARLLALLNEDLARAVESLERLRRHVPMPDT